MYRKEYSHALNELLKKKEEFKQEIIFVNDEIRILKEKFINEKSKFKIKDKVKYKIDNKEYYILSINTIDKNGYFYYDIGFFLKSFGNSIIFKDCKCIHIKEDKLIKI